MIVYNKNGSLVFATIIPKKDSKKFNQVIEINPMDSEFYELQDLSTYDDYSEFMAPKELHERFCDCLSRNNCYTYKKTKIDFKNKIGYLELFDKTNELGTVSQFRLVTPTISEFCIKGSFNSFQNGRKNPRNEGCNLFNMLNNDKNALKELKEILKSEDQEYIKEMITKLWPEFAKFYYELSKEFEIEETCIFNVRALNQIRKIDPQAEPMLEMLPIADDNTKILRLLPKKD